MVEKRQRERDRKRAREKHIKRRDGGEKKHTLFTSRHKHTTGIYRIRPEGGFFKHIELDRDWIKLVDKKNVTLSLELEKIFFVNKEL